MRKINDIGDEEPATGDPIGAPPVGVTPTPPNPAAGGVPPWGVNVLAAPGTLGPAPRVAGISKPVG